jgi:hypothetical protein
MGVDHITISKYNKIIVDQVTNTWEQESERQTQPS